MLCEQSSRTTVAQEDWYSHWWTRRSEYSMSSGRGSPSRWMAEDRGSVMSRFSVSPNSYCFDAPLDSMPVAKSRGSLRPELEPARDPNRSRWLFEPDE